MARANRRRLFRLPRRADQQPGAERVSIPRPRSLASAVMSAQPKSTSAMDAHDETGRRVPPPAASPASLAECALRRQTPEVGAECPNWARSELSGGRSETGVPTGNNARANENRHGRSRHDEFLRSIRSQLAAEEGDCAGSGVIGDVAVLIEIKAVLSARIDDQLRLSFQHLGAIDQRAAFSDRNDVVGLAVQRQ